MTKSNKGFNILDYKHSRNANYKTTADELFLLINNFSEKKELNNFYNYFEEKYKLPEKVVKQTLRQYFANSYELKSRKFNHKLLFKSIPKYLALYGSLIYALFFVKIKKNIRNYQLIIDFITSSIEMKRWENLLNLFGPDNVLCVTRQVDLQKDFTDYNFFNKNKFHDIKFVYLLKSIFYEYFFGLWIILKVSFRVRVNLLPISLKVIHDYLTFKSLFELNKSPFLIQEKHYSSEPIKNHLFKKLGGTASTSIQKNIIANEPIFFYMDFDILFSLGEDGCKRIFEYGGRVDLIKPVGSLFMESIWFDKKKEIKKKFDIAILGINTSNAYERLDSYDKFIDDSYAIYRWAAKLSLQKPEYNIVVIHHVSAGEDLLQDEILKNSNIKVLDQNINSYEIAFSSKIAFTYGSTMGFELNAHDLPTFFIDPGFRCMFLPEKGLDYVDCMRVDTYDKFSSLANELLEKDKITNNLVNINSNKLCLNSQNVANKIYNYLINTKKLS